MDELRTFKARSIQEAIATVRKELGPEASVLHTRRLPSGVWSWLTSSPRFEVTASATIQAPSRLDILLDEESPDAESSTELALQDEPDVEIEVEDVRAGQTGLGMRYVLAIGIVLVVLGFVFLGGAWFGQ